MDMLDTGGHATTVSKSKNPDYRSYGNELLRNDPGWVNYPGEVEYRQHAADNARQFLENW